MVHEEEYQEYYYDDTTGEITRRALARLTMTLNTAPEEEESSAEGRGGAGPPQPIGHHPGLLGLAQ